MGQKKLQKVRRLVALTITGKDRPGIIAALTGAIYQTGGNLEDASMTILQGEFAMILIASVSAIHLEILANKLQRLGDLTISIKELSGLKRGERHAVGTVPYVISVFGRDRAGIVYQIAKTLASRRVNITDLNSRITGQGANTVYTVILEADFPAVKAKAQAITKALQSIAKKLKVTISASQIQTAHL